MTINLNDKKIVKVVYAVDDFSELDINFSDGEICSINRRFKKIEDNHMDVIKDILSKSRKLKDTIFKYKSAPKEEKNVIDDLMAAKQLVEMENNGQLDEIANKYKNECCKPFKEIIQGGKIEINTSDEPHIYEQESDDFSKAIDDMNMSKHTVKEELNACAENMTINEEELNELKKTDDKESNNLVNDTTMILMELEKRGKFDEIVKAYNSDCENVYKSKLSQIILDVIEEMHKNERGTE